MYLKKYTDIICPSDIKNERPLAFSTCFCFKQTEINVEQDFSRTCSTYGRVSWGIRATVWILKVLHYLFNLYHWSKIKGYVENEYLTFL